MNNVAMTIAQNTADILPAATAPGGEFMPAAAHSGIVSTLMGITSLGATWVLWLLLALSVVSLAIIFERSLFFYRTRLNFDEFIRTLTLFLQKGNVTGAVEFCQQSSAFESQIAADAFASEVDGIEAMEKGMIGFVARLRCKMDYGLTFLGTLGNNAPFIGLFGTVLGIIQAFEDLSLNPSGGPTIVMAGISEALIATAVGLFVAIPAVIAFNWFQRIISKRLSQIEAVESLVLKHYVAKGTRH